MICEMLPVVIVSIKKFLYSDEFSSGFLKYKNPFTTFRNWIPRPFPHQLLVL